MIFSINSPVSVFRKGVFFTRNHLLSVIFSLSAFNRGLDTLCTELVNESRFDRDFYPEIRRATYHYLDVPLGKCLFDSRQ